MAENNLWTQPLPGRYVKGNETINVIRYDWFKIEVNGEVEWVDHSADECENEILKRGLPPIAYPVRTDTSDKWVKHDYCDLSDKWKVLAAWYKSVDNDHRVLLLNYCQGNTYLYVWDTGWQFNSLYKEGVIDYFSNEEHTQPVSDYTIALDESLQHGGSGMARRWYPESFDELFSILDELCVTDGIDNVKEIINTLDK